MINSSLLMTVIVEIVAMQQVFSYTEGCVGEFCFKTPDSNELRNFDGAKSGCNDKNSALAVVNNSYAQLALTQFLTSSNTNAMTFINIKLYQHDYTWFLVNGSKYDGQIGNQYTRDYKLYGYLKLYGSHFQVDASKSNETNHYICDYEDARCLNISTNNVLYNGRCYVKYETETLTWYQARGSCVNNGGDLAQFQKDPSLNGYIPQLNTSWLNPSLTYWVGIRWNDRRWKSPDDGNEAIFTSWSREKPNTYDYQCVCADPNGSPVWSWTDCNCGDSRQYVCLKIVPTITTSTTTTTTTAPPTLSTTSEVITVFNPNSTTNALAIALGVGLGGGVFIILVVVLVVVVVMIMRKRRGRSRNGVESTNNVELNHEHPRNETRSIPTAYSDFYAAIVPAAKNQINDKDTPQSNIIYETPEFPQNQNSSCDPANTRRAKVQSIMLDGPRDVYANTTSGS